MKFKTLHLESFDRNVSAIPTINPRNSKSIHGNGVFSKEINTRAPTAERSYPHHLVLVDMLTLIICLLCEKAFPKPSNLVRHVDCIHNKET